MGRKRSVVLSGDEIENNNDDASSLITEDGSFMCVVSLGNENE